MSNSNLHKVSLYLHTTWLGNPLALSEETGLNWAGRRPSLAE